MHSNDFFDSCFKNARNDRNEGPNAIQCSFSNIPFYSEIESNIAQLSDCDIESLENRVDRLIKALPENDYDVITFQKLQFYRGLQEHKIQEALSQIKTFDFIGDIVRLSPYLDRNILENSDPNTALAYYFEQNKKSKPQDANIEIETVPIPLPQPLVSARNQQPMMISESKKATSDAAFSDSTKSPDLNFFKRTRSDDLFDYESCAGSIIDFKSVHKSGPFASKKSFMVDFDKVKNLLDTHMEEEFEIDQHCDVLREIKNINHDDTRGYFSNFV